jgi:hypothetical protein
VLASQLRSQVANRAWLYLTGFVGVSLLQSAYTGISPLREVLKAMEFKFGEAYR